MLLFVGLIVYPAWADDYSLFTLRDILLFGIFALSLDFLWGKTGTMSFGHATFFGLGAYGMAVVTVKFQPDPAYASLLGLVPVYSPVPASPTTRSRPLPQPSSPASLLKFR